ncbi:sulfatase-like hydrolase/transferase [Pleomorphochaeta sp. DL1XJH-081]|uniref:sulfatase-like hydrolase/transferase n=1 Tax=Pleomorphochaeta sp. DL1XJH-081 TaxID=3409690 RepID=UPI003BB736B2
MGLVIPSNLIQTSPPEFSYISERSTHPTSFVISSLLTYLGILIFWPIIIYQLSKESVKKSLVIIFSIIAIYATFNVFFFQTNSGSLSPYLEFDNITGLINLTILQKILPFFIFIIVSTLLIFLFYKKRTEFVKGFLIILCSSFLIFGVRNIWHINNGYTIYTKNLSKFSNNTNKELTKTSINPPFTISRQGKNVVILFLDRALSSYFPYIIKQHPKLSKIYDGFQYYPNTVSMGSHTITGAPAMLGGYEYIPESLNSRKDLSLLEKHNESLLVLPRIFLDHGYSTKLSNPPFSNYRWEADFTPFVQYPKIEVFNLLGRYTWLYKKDHNEINNLQTNGTDIATIIRKKLNQFSIFQSLPPVFRPKFYDNGYYFLIDQQPSNLESFINSYSSLYYLEELFNIEEHGNTFTLLSNETTHTPIMLEAPLYEPKLQPIDISTPLDDVFGSNTLAIAHYHANAAAILQIGDWLEDLKSQGVYDNTRIIIVSDHGEKIISPAFEGYPLASEKYNLFHSLLVYKDFNTSGPLRYNYNFMTNADTPLLATKEIIYPVINPFTNLNMEELVNKNPARIFEGPWNPSNLSGNTMELFWGFEVKEDIFNSDNWKQL